MSTYISGSKEEVILDMSCDAAGFAVASWTGEVAFCTLGQEDEFDADVATWYAATLTAGATSDVFTAKLMLTVDVTLAKGAYSAFVRLTKTGDSTAEQPVIPASGYVEIV